MLLTIPLTHPCSDFVERTGLGKAGAFLNKYLHVLWKRFCLAASPLFKLRKRCGPQICQYASINIWRITCFIKEKGQTVRKRFCELRLKIVVSIYSSVSLFILDRFSSILLGLFHVYKLEKLLTNKGTTLSNGLIPSFQGKNLPLTFVASPSIKGMIKESKILPLAVLICIITHPQRAQLPFPQHTCNSHIIK